MRVESQEPVFGYDIWNFPELGASDAGVQGLEFMVRSLGFRV